MLLTIQHIYTTHPVFRPSPVASGLKTGSGRDLPPVARLPPVRRRKSLARSQNPRRRVRIGWLRAGVRVVGVEPWPYILQYIQLHGIRDGFRALCQPFAKQKNVLAMNAAKQSLSWPSCDNLKLQISNLFSILRLFDKAETKQRKLRTFSIVLEDCGLCVS